MRHRLRHPPANDRPFNDNNFTGGAGRDMLSDTTDFRKITWTWLIPESGTWALMAATLVGQGWWAWWVSRRA